MKLNIQKRLAASITKSSPKRVRFDSERLEDIKESITKADIGGLIKDKAILIRQKKGSSKSRIRKKKIQKRKGRQRGSGLRKGKETARSPKKEVWKNKIRKMRAFIKKLKDKNKIIRSVRQDLYKKAKGGFFRNLRHLKTYIEEHKLMKK